MGALTLAKSIDVRSKSSFRTPFQRPDYCVSIGLFGEMKRARTFALDEATQKDTVTKRRMRHVLCQLP